MLMAAGALGFVGSLLGFGLTAAQVFRAQVPLFGLVALATALACHVLVPLWGLYGAADALLVAAGIQCVGAGWVLHRALVASQPPAARPALVRDAG